MTQLPSHPQLQGLTQRLTQGRARLQWLRFIEGLSWGILLAATLWLALGLLGWIGLIESDSLIYFLPIAVLAFWLVILTFGIVRTLPSLLQIAQKAERFFGLEERLSTALEVVHKSPKDTAHAYIYQALLKDALTKTELINPKQLFQFRLPKTLPYALGIAVLALGLQFIPAISPQNPAQLPPLSKEEQTTTITQLERITQLVQRDAERSNDPYLQATVRSLEQLKSQIKSGQLAAPLVQQEIARLSEQIERGYNLPSSTQSNTVNNSSTTAQNPVPDGSQANTPQNQIKPSDKPNSTSTALSQPAGSTPSQRLENLAKQLQAKAEQPQGQTPTPTPQNQSQQADCSGGACSDIYAKARAEQAKASAAQNQVKRPQGGAAGGFGNQAGKDAGGKSGARGDTPQTGKVEQVKLPFQAPPSGRRIQILGPSSSSSPNIVSGTVEAQNWTRQEEVPIGLGYLASPNRSIVSNYFTPTKESP